MNQLQYLLKTCSEQGKTVAPISMQTNSSSPPADVYYDITQFNKMIKFSPKLSYCKVEPGMTVPQLREHLAPSKMVDLNSSVPLTYPHNLMKDDDPSLEQCI